jgi:hypothetical protein
VVVLSISHEDWGYNGVWLEVDSLVLKELVLEEEAGRGMDWRRDIRHGGSRVLSL